MNRELNVTPITGRALPLRGRDIDTDRIMPARYLKAITFAGLERHLFADDRRALADRGAMHPFENPAYSGAAILLVNSNFGCGSSREHAPQALTRWGIRAIIGESFAEIFAGNALMIGLACVAARPDVIETLMHVVEHHPTLELTVDLVSQRVTAGEVSEAITLPAATRAALISGEWDGTGLLSDRYEEVEKIAAGLPYLNGF